ncbi:MAG: tetratricopeptide repeat protein [Candidatus Cloacimonetes bacterium]|nr:tetratricopeptide repeat protein [Candidatus Cloacimonadota bacterium]
MVIRGKQALGTAFLGIVTVLFIFSGCSQNIIETPDGSRPNEYSAYLYSAGNLLYYQNDYAGAAEVYRMALRYDRNSRQIKKALFNALYHQVYHGRIPIQVFSGFVDTLLVQKAMDKQMLERTHDLYTQRKDFTGAKAVLEVYLRSYASANAYTSLFYLEQQLFNKNRLELLDKAFKLADKDAVFLNSLGYLYQHYNQSKAEKIWLQALKYDSTSQAASHLWNLYNKQSDNKKLIKLWNTFHLPQDKEKLAQVTAQSISSYNFQSLINLSDLLLKSDETELIINLLMAANLTNNNKVFTEAKEKLESLMLTKAQSQFKAFLVALHSLNNNDIEQSIAALSVLEGKKALDEVLTGYRSLALTSEKDKNPLILEQVRNTLKETFVQASEEQLPASVRNYLLAATDSLGISNQIELSDSLTLPCVQWFYDNNKRTYDTYLWLGTYYTRTKQTDKQISLLEEAIEQFQEDASLLNWLGYSYVLMADNLDEAEILIKRALQLAPDNPYYLDSLAWLEYIRGNYEEALRLMEIPSQLEKMPSEIAFHIGKILLALNKIEDAVKYLKLAVEINDDPDFVSQSLQILNSLEP